MWSPGLPGIAQLLVGSSHTCPFDVGRRCLSAISWAEVVRCPGRSDRAVDRSLDNPRWVANPAVPGGLYEVGILGEAAGLGAVVGVEALKAGEVRPAAATVVAAPGHGTTCRGGSKAPATRAAATSLLPVGPLERASRRRSG